MKTFRQFLESTEQLNYTNLGFPPWAKTQNGQYFLDPDGNINFVASGRRGVMDVGSFKKIYDQFFAKDITPQKASELVKSYGEKMHDPKLSDAPQATHQIPPIYQGKGMSWVSDEDGVIGKIGGQPFDLSHEEFQKRYGKSIGHKMTFDLDAVRQKASTPTPTNQERLAQLRQQQK